MSNDEDRLQAQLDAHPEDTHSRLILADLLEERGDEDAARCQRWLGTEAKWPDSDLGAIKKKGWHWWSRPDAQRKREHAALPLPVQTYMPQGEWLYATRREAEEVLARALAELAKREAKAGS
jgi:uncharacterized protein (TIGR02996 family)